MQRNDEPGLSGFSQTGYNFGTDSVINNLKQEKAASVIPILQNEFLLLPSPLDFFLLLDGSNLLLLGS
jgi:hypothetical protein